jgi:acyl dehydratase
MDLEQVKAKVFPQKTVAYSARDTILYALSVGAGEDPLDEVDLRFVYEPRLKALPTLACVLASPGFWMQDPVLKMDCVRLLHGEQSVEMRKPLPAEGVVKANFRIVGVKDGGPEKGATVYLDRELSDEAGELLCTARTTYVFRGDGGCGDFGETQPNAAPLPDREPDRRLEIATLPRQALIYKLNGDPNPLHVDPAVARKAGFDRPILHGLCTMGLACRGLVRSYCDGDPDRLVDMFVRFASPMYPGETIRLECFEEGTRVRFRARAVERDVVILDRSTVTLRG